MEKEIRDILEAPFAPEMIKQREGSYGGQTLDYVEGWAVVQRLNEAFDGDWTFEIERFKILEDEVVVLGKFSANGIVKTQFGSSSITRSEDTGKPICLGDDLKGAATDAIKKCATMLGVALYLYNGQGTSLVTVSEKEGAIFCSAATSLPGTSNIGSAPSEKSSGGGSVADSRLTSKQYNFIQHLCRELRMAKEELAKKTMEVYNVQPEYLSKAQASELINKLLAQ